MVRSFFVVFSVLAFGCGGAADPGDPTAMEQSAPAPAPASVPVDSCGSCTNDYRLPLGCGGNANAATVSCPLSCNLTGSWWYQEDGGTCVEALVSGTTATWCCER